MEGGWGVLIIMILNHEDTKALSITKLFVLLCVLSDFVVPEFDQYPFVIPFSMAGTPSFIHGGSGAPFR